MFQHYVATSSPDTGANRLKKLRSAFADVDGFLVPRADVHQGENVAASSERLAWLTGFSGSAGMCIALRNVAGVFVDGRYSLQVRDEIDLSVFTPVALHEVKFSDWLIENLPSGGTIAYDPWLHPFDEIEKLEIALQATDITLVKSDNLVDKVWSDRPDPPKGMIQPHGVEYAGEESVEKRARIGDAIQKSGLNSFVLTLPDSICWLLNIRGADISRTPVVLCFAILHENGRVDLFVDPDKCDYTLIKHLGDDIKLHPEATLSLALKRLEGAVGVDRASAPIAISELLQNPVWHKDPCIMPKACKNSVEIEGARAAHLRDGAAMVEFLFWLETEAPKGNLTEISVSKQLETFRRNTNALRDVSFDTISGSGPNGAIVHYRVNEGTDRSIISGDILLIDSGGQYQDGTTDITRTVPVGPVSQDIARNNTLVLRGMIAISMAQFPHGITGRELDSFARMPLWQSGLDYAHGTGHGVGSYLGVHEGPQAISRRSNVPLESGMILSNEPGYYKEGEYGIRIENLIVVNEAKVPNGGEIPMHGFETLTLVPIDRRLIISDMLSNAERDWLNDYHDQVFEKISPLVSSKTRTWLENACANI